MSKPIRVGEILRLSISPEILYVIRAREKFNTDSPEKTVAFSAVAAAANSGFIDLDDLDPRETPPELVQIRLGFEDGFDYYIKYPSGTNIHGVNLDKDVGFINSERSPALAPNDDYEYFATHGWWPTVNAKNHTAYSDTPKVYAEGWRYTLRKASPGERAVITGGRKIARWIQMGGVAQQEGS